MDAPRIIKNLGGTTEVARLLKLGRYGPQRVSNWIKRGIPLWVQLEHGSLLRKAEQAPDDVPPPPDRRAGERRAAIAKEA